jgi:sirohydrochlorin cobaltochelatase
MFMPGGPHPEVEMPQSLDHLRPLYPGVELRYTWQFDLTLVANTLTEEVNRFS